MSFIANSIAPWTRRLCAAIALVCTLIGSFAHAECIRDYRNLQFSDGSARIRSYLCSSENASLRVEFHRLSEVAIGSILLGEPLDSVEKVLGHPRVVPNMVYSELKELYDKFGTRSFRPGSDNGFNTEIKIETPRGGTSYTGGTTSPDGWYIWDISQGQSITIPNNLPIARKGNGLRYMSSAELAVIISDMRRSCKKPSGPCSKYPFMLLYMTGGGSLPKDLAILSVKEGAESCEYDLSMLVRPIISTVVVIENNSYSELRIDNILGSQFRYSQNRFRIGLLQNSSRIVASPIEGPITIPAKGRVMLFLAITLGTGGIDEGKKGDLKLNEYTYGPEVAVSGVRIGDSTLMFDEASANYMEVSASQLGMSCPILYAFYERDKAWLSLGKVIHEANERRREVKQTIQLPGLARLFRIVEEESERSFVNSVELHVKLHDGTQHDFKPSRAELRDTDARYLEISPFEGVEIAFDVPDWITSTEVESASISITGYYERVHWGASVSRARMSRP